MKKIALSIFALISCLSLGSCSGENPSSSVTLGENDSLSITQNSQKINYDYKEAIACSGYGIIGNLLLYPFDYCKIKVDVFSSYLKVYINFDFKKLNSDFDKLSPEYSPNYAKVYDIYSIVDTNRANLLGKGFAINDDVNNRLFVYDQYKNYTYTYGFNSLIQFNITQESSK